jgi:two-component system sensor histidine kinase/response regulator
LGVGSHFHFTAKFGFGAERGSGVHKVANSTVLDGVKVLIVDDNSTNRRILEGLVTQWGMNPLPCPMLESALNELSTAQEIEKPYRLMLTDMNMPDVDGFTSGGASHGEAGDFDHDDHDAQLGRTGRRCSTL